MTITITSMEARTAKPASNLLPIIKCVALDETPDWSEYITEHTSKIFTLYIYDETSEIFCCEARPSYWLGFYKYVATPAEGREFIPDDILDDIELSSVDGHYIHCHSLLNTKTYTVKNYNLFPQEYDPEDWDCTVEGWLEYLNCNHIIPDFFL